MSGDLEMDSVTKPPERLRTDYDDHRPGEGKQDSTLPYNTDQDDDDDDDCVILETSLFEHINTIINHSKRLSSPSRGSRYLHSCHRDGDLRNDNNDDDDDDCVILNYNPFEEVRNPTISLSKRLSLNSEASHTHNPKTNPCKYNGDDFNDDGNSTFRKETTSTNAYHFKNHSTKGKTCHHLRVVETKPCVVIVDDDCAIIDNDDCVIIETNSFEEEVTNGIFNLTKKLSLDGEAHSHFHHPMSSWRLQDEDDISIIAEKGEVACRDYPHPRHLCAQYPFNRTPHESCCGQCYCFVCEIIAPCKYWTGSVDGHCHASDIDSKWKGIKDANRLSHAD